MIVVPIGRSPQLASRGDSCGEIFYFRNHVGSPAIKSRRLTKVHGRPKYSAWTNMQCLHASEQQPIG